MRARLLSSPSLTSIDFCCPVNGVAEEVGICSKRVREVEDNTVHSLHAVPSKAQRPREEEKGKRWTRDQDDLLRKAVEEYGQRNWKAIASRVDGRNHAQCLQRWNKVLKPGLVKGHWSFEEDSTLEQMVLQGCQSWGEVAAHISGRTAKQCRERWRNHLDPSINKLPFSPEEDIVIQRGFEDLGNRWTQIAELLPGRTEDAVKMRWKAMNPNRKVKAKPGRPKLMPGMTLNKQRNLVPSTPDDVVASLINGPITIPETSTFESEFSIQLPCFGNGISSTPLSMHSTQIDGSISKQNLPRTQELLPGQFYEPIVEPRSDITDAGNEMRDALILKELLHSHSNGLLSFGSTRGLSSITDMSPEVLLASGELDEMFRATMSISKEKGVSSRLSHSLMDSLTSSYKNAESLQQAGQNLDHEEKHLFHEFIDSWRAQNAIGEDATVYGTASLLTDANKCTQYSAVISSGRKSAHSLDFEGSRSLIRRNSNGILHELGNASNDIGDLLDSDLMRPIRKGKLYL